jgi:hypothetical protein
VRSTDSSESARRSHVNQNLGPGRHAEAQSQRHYAPGSPLQGSRLPGQLPLNNGT